MPVPCKDHTDDDILQRPHRIFWAHRSRPGIIVYENKFLAVAALCAQLDYDPAWRGRWMPQFDTLPNWGPEVWNWVPPQDMQYQAVACLQAGGVHLETFTGCVLRTWDANVRNQILVARVIPARKAK